MNIQDRLLRPKKDWISLVLLRQRKLKSDYHPFPTNQYTTDSESITKYELEYEYEWKNR